jgi:hypothetical protein
MEIAAAWSRAITLVETIAASPSMRPWSRASAAVVLEQLQGQHGPAATWTLGGCDTLSVTVRSLLSGILHRDAGLPASLRPRLRRCRWELQQIADGAAAWREVRATPDCIATCREPWGTVDGRARMGRYLFGLGVHHVPLAPRPVAADVTRISRGPAARFASTTIRRPHPSVWAREA